VLATRWKFAGSPRCARSAQAPPRPTWGPSARCRGRVGGIAHEREPIGNGGRHDAELREHGFLSEYLAACTIEADDTRTTHALGEIFVGRTDDDPLDTRIHGEALGRSCERIVAFELDHGPHHETECTAGVFGRLELPPKRSVHSGAGLVAGEERIAKRLDDVIERDGYMRNTRLGEQRQQRADEPVNGADFASGRTLARSVAVVRAEQLVGAVDEMHIHARSSSRAVEAV
jgi:hypothetical protein